MWLQNHHAQVSQFVLPTYFPQRKWHGRRPNNDSLGYSEPLARNIFRSPLVEIQQHFFVFGSFFGLSSTEDQIGKGFGWEDHDISSRAFVVFLLGLNILMMLMLLFFIFICLVSLLLCFLHYSLVVELPYVGPIITRCVA